MYQIVDNFLIINLDIIKGFFLLNAVSFAVLIEVVLILILVLLLRRPKENIKCKVRKKLRK